jgi:hypothetical protein
MKSVHASDGELDPGWQSGYVDRRGCESPITDHPATSLGPPCAIATSTATIRVPVDHPTIANASGTGGVKSRSTLFQILYEKLCALAD